MPQTVILDAPPKGYAGQIAEAGAPRYVRSCQAEAVATRAINAGDFVLRGTDPESQVIAITDGATVDAATLMGVVLLETSRPLEEAPPVEGSDLGVLRFGPVRVTVSAAVTAGNPVFVGNTTATLGDVEGASGAGLVAAPGCRFLSSAGSGETAIAWLNLA